MNKEVYYFSDGGKVLQEIKSKKDVWEYAGEQGGEIKKYIKEQKLGVNQKEDLAKIVAFINLLEKD